MKYVVLKMDGSKEILERTEPLPLEDMQKLVGGYIEAVRFSADSDFMMMVNEDGLQLKLAANPHCLGIVGNVVIGKMSVANLWV